MKPVVALDFDGVICDSLDECLLTAYNAYRRFDGETGRAHSVSELDLDFVSRFRRQRYLVRPAPEYWLLVHWLLSQPDDLDMESFEALRGDYKDTLTAFEPIFFDVRTELRRTDAEFWSGLHRPYEECATSWDSLSRICKIHLVTTKDLESVRHFNGLWELGLQDDRLWTHERAPSKAWAIRRIAVTENCTPSDIAFVDDDLRHLRDVSETGARCYWASWGYTSAAGFSLDTRSGASSLAQLSDLLDHFVR